MTQVRAALAAQGFDALHAMAVVGHLRDGARQGLKKAGPATACIEFGIGHEQRRIATNAAVVPVRPVLLVLAGKRAFGRSVACDRKSRKLSLFGLQQRLPLLGGFLDRKLHSGV